jgi:hypothetical protein
MRCTYCNKEIDEDSVFCPGCGKKTAGTVPNETGDDAPVPAAGKASAQRITIVFDSENDNAPLADLLETALNTSGVYAAVKQSKADYEAENVKHELLGTSDSAPVIFAGNINDAFVQNVQWQYNELGMMYGWLENQAMLCVVKGKWNQEELAKLTALFGESASAKPDNFLKKGLDNITGKVDKLPLGLKIAGAVGGAVLFGLGGLAIVGGTYLINGKINNDKVFENQAKYLVGKFCGEALSEFIGGI